VEFDWAQLAKFEVTLGGRVSNDADPVVKQRMRG